MFILIELPDKTSWNGKTLKLMCNLNGNYSSWTEFWRAKGYVSGETNYSELNMEFYNFLCEKGYVEVGYQYFMIPEGENHGR